VTASVPESDPALLAAEQFARCSVRLRVFEGPLDLLLHLIRINEVEITDIPIARIGEQYLECGRRVPRHGSDARLDQITDASAGRARG